MEEINIIIPCYKRSSELLCLLDSLKIQTNYAFRFKIWFFIDFSSKQTVVEETIVGNITDMFNYEIVKRNERYGLKANIINSVSEVFKMTQSDNVILLEDDLLISPSTFNFVQNCINTSIGRYKDIFGISLYSPSKNPWNDIRVIHDSLEGFFLLKVPSSLGTLLFRDRWFEFTQKLDSNLELKTQTSNGLIPSPINSWNRKNSWKAELIRFMISNNVYFLYPTISFTAHLSYNGTNVDLDERNTNFNSTLSKEYNKYFFESFDIDKLTRYDAFFEVLPDSFESVFDKSITENLAVDFYGLKSIDINHKYYLTSKEVNKSIETFGFELEQPSKNIEYNIKGDFFKLTKSENITGESSLFKDAFFQANYSNKGRKALLKYVLLEFWKKCKSYFVN